MKVGLIGSGNMARAMARGWGEPVLCTDSGSGRAQALVDELGGERVASNRELAERVDLVVLCHKPYQLAQVAREIGRYRDRPLRACLAATTAAKLQRSYPRSQVFRADAEHAGRDPPRASSSTQSARAPHVDGPVAPPHSMWRSRLTCSRSSVGSAAS